VHSRLVRDQNFTAVLVRRVHPAKMSGETE
jgi:hypothetical protein